MLTHQLLIVKKLSASEAAKNSAKFQFNGYQLPLYNWNKLKLEESTEMLTS